MGRDIPENHLASLRQMCSLPGVEPLPEKLTNRYWALKTCLDRVGQGGGMSMGDLARLCVEAGFGKPTEAELHPSFVQLFRTKKIAVGADVLVNWREKKVAGTLVSVDALNRITVLVDGEERKVAAECVTLQAAA